MSSWFQSALITLQAPALSSWCQTDSIIKCREEAATRSWDQGDGGGGGLICHWSALQQHILPWSPSVDSPIKTLGHENMRSRATVPVHLDNGYSLWFSFSNTNTQAGMHKKKNPQLTTRTLTCTHDHPQTPTASICSPTHHSIVMLSDCFPLFACHSPVTVWILY